MNLHLSPFIEKKKVEPTPSHREFVHILTLATTTLNSPETCVSSY